MHFQVNTAFNLATVYWEQKPIISQEAPVLIRHTECETHGPAPSKVSFPPISGVSAFE